MPAPTPRVDELGFPLPSSFEDLGEGPPRSNLGWGPFLFKYRWCVLLLLLPLLFGQPLIVAARRFIAQRLLNNATMQFEDDHLQEALASVDRALSWEPDSFQRWQEYETRAEICQEMRDHPTDCVDSWTEVIKRLDDPARSKVYSQKLCNAYDARASIFERLGRHREAIADSTTALNIAVDGQRAICLNQRAYFRALANIELDQAMQDVQQSLNSRPNDPEIVDTRGYIFFRLGKYDLARKDLDQAIQAWTAPLGWFRGYIGPRQLAELDELPPRARRQYLESLAVMYHHRGEIRKKLGQEVTGENDIRRAKDMGYDPERGVN